MKVASYWYSTGTIYYAIIEKKELDKLDFALCKGPDNIGGRQTLKQYYDSCNVKPDLMVNAGFFNMANGETVFTYKDEYKTIMDYGPQYHKGIGTVGENRELTYGNFNGYQWIDFVTAYPPLVVNSEFAPRESGAWTDTGLTGRHPRTVVGWNNDYIYLISASGHGKTLEEMAEFCKNYLKCTYAVNLDGGGSTAMLKGDTYVVSSVRPVDNILAVYLKKEVAPAPAPTPQPTQEKILYRVQCGAYGSKANADALAAKIKAYPEYAGAYVRLVDGLYKVQVGAYSVRDNALKTMSDLQNKGFSCFITTK